MLPGIVAREWWGGGGGVITYLIYLPVTRTTGLTYKSSIILFHHIGSCSYLNTQYSRDNLRVRDHNVLNLSGVVSPECYNFSDDYRIQGNMSDHYITPFSTPLFQIVCP